jgi:hypothetical protein
VPDPRRVIDARDALLQRHDRVLRDLAMLRAGLAGGRLRRVRIRRIEKEAAKLQRGIAKLESLLS